MLDRSACAVKIREDDTAVQPWSRELRAHALRHIDKLPSEITQDSTLLRLICIEAGFRDMLQCNGNKIKAILEF